MDSQRHYPDKSMRTSYDIFDLQMCRHFFRINRISKISLLFFVIEVLCYNHIICYSQKHRTNFNFQFEKPGILQSQLFLSAVIPLPFPCHHSRASWYVDSGEDSTTYEFLGRRLRELPLFSWFPSSFSWFPPFPLSSSLMTIGACWLWFRWNARVRGSRPLRTTFWDVELSAGGEAERPRSTRN